MLHVVINVSIFILIFISYFVVIKGVIGFPSIVIGFLFNVLYFIFLRKKPNPHILELYTRIEVFLGLILIIVSVACFWIFGLWNQDSTWAKWIRIWENPLIIAILFFTYIWQAGLSGSDSPILRRMAFFAILSSLSIPAIVLYLRELYYFC
jgi:hypothetical protein